MTDKIIAKKYKVIRELGRGGMGVIYEALHLGLNRRVAIKVLHSQFTNDSAFLKRFQREARAMARLDHENIIRVFDVSEDQGTHYIEMEYFGGGDLKQHMIKESPFSQEKAFLIAYRVAKALVFAHAHGVIHRDIKPANIMINSANLVKIADFGIAAATGEVSLTATGNIIGTPEYMSPEQARGEEEIDGRSDFYSLGMLIHEMITGETTFGGISGMAILGKLVYDSKEFNLSLPEDTLPSVKTLTTALLLKNRIKRITDAETLLNQIESILEELQGKPNHLETDIQTDLLRTPEEEEEKDIPETVILSNLKSKEKESESNLAPPTVLVQKGISEKKSKKMTQEEKSKKWTFLIFAISAVFILAGTFYYYSSIDDKEIVIQELSPSEPHSPLIDEIQALKEKEEKAEQDRLRQEARDRAKQEKLEKEKAQAELEQLKQENAEQDRLRQEAGKRAKQEKLEKEKAQAELEQLKQENAEQDRLGHEARDRAKQEKREKEKAQAELEQLKQENAEQDRLRQEARDRAKQEKLEKEKAKAEKERLIREKAATKRKKLEQERIKAEKEQKKQEKIAEEKKSSLTPITPNEMNVLGGIINNLKTAYEKKDLEVLQNMSRMSKKRTRFLKQIFNNYKNIKISIGDLSMVGNEAHVAISITELTSQDDNQVVPSIRWKDAELILHRKEGKWGKVVW